MDQSPNPSVADLLAQGASWLAGMFKEHASQQVVYARGASSASVSATIGRTDWELPDNSGIVTRWQSRDFLILTADLMLDGSAVAPKRGDRITCAGSVYEVLPPAGVPEWKHADAYANAYRIHTRKVGREL